MRKLEFGYLDIVWIVYTGGLKNTARIFYLLELTDGFNNSFLAHSNLRKFIHSEPFETETNGQYQLVVIELIPNNQLENCSKETRLEKFPQFPYLEKCARETISIFSPMRTNFFYNEIRQI